MSEGDVRRSSISQATSYEEMAAYWDEHDLTEHWESTREVEVEFRIPRRHQVAIADEVFKKLATVSRQQGVQPETLVNLWLSERLHHVQAPDVSESSGESTVQGAEGKVELASHT